MSTDTFNPAAPGPTSAAGVLAREDFPASWAEAGTPESPASNGGEAAGALRTLFHAYRGRILFTYGLFNLENLLRLAQPLVLGLAIDDLLHGAYLGVFLFLAQHLCYMAISTGRRMYDMRVFTGIYTDLATRLVLEQRGRAEEVSRVAARSALSRDFVSFFERDVPLVMEALYSVVGALVLLPFYDSWLVPLCLALLAPVWLLNRVYARKTLQFNRRLHDEFENEVAVIGRGRPPEVFNHYRLVGRWRIKLADWEALNFGLTELFVLGLLGAALVRACLGTEASPGEIFAVFRYVLMFIMGLDSVPMLVRQVSSLRDIGRRMQVVPLSPEPVDGCAL